MFSLTVLLYECVCYFALSRQDVFSLQECMGLIRRLCVEEGAGSELANKLTENLKETQSVNKVRADTVLSILIIDMLNVGSAYDDTHYPLTEA